MRPPWNPTYGLANVAQHRKYVIHEAYRRRLIVKRRPPTEAERLFERDQFTRLHALLRQEIDLRAEAIRALEAGVESIPVFGVQPEATYSIKPDRDRQIVVTINGELWASIRWIYHNLEHSIGCASLSSWLRNYRGCVRHKLSPDGHLCLYHLGDFKEWRHKSLKLQVRHHQSVREQRKEARQ